MLTGKKTLKLSQVMETSVQVWGSYTEGLKTDPLSNEEAKKSN